MQQAVRASVWTLRGLMLGAKESWANLGVIGSNQLPCGHALTCSAELPPAPCPHDGCMEHLARVILCSCYAPGPRDDSGVHLRCLAAAAPRLGVLDWNGNDYFTDSVLNPKGSGGSCKAVGAARTPQE